MQLADLLRGRIARGHWRAGERVPVESYAYHYPVKIDGKTINVAYGGTGNYVAISLPDGVTDRALLDTIARHVDKALATGKYDSLFGK